MTRTMPRLSAVIATFNNVKVLTECLDSWREFGAGQDYELIVIEDGCKDATASYLEAQSATPWGQRHLRWVHENNVHELRATNRGLSEARAPIILSWQDDMFLRTKWFVPELLAVFERHLDIGMLCLSRGMLCLPCDEPMTRWEDVIDWRRLQSTIGRAPLNWIRLTEVDGVIRPWAVRRACLDRVGVLDEVFVPTGWDESDLAFRIRAAGWRIATHGYERVGAYKHLGSSTLSKFSLNLDRDFENGRLFFSRWDAAIRAGATRRRTSWLRPLSAAAGAGTLRVAVNFAIQHRRRAMLRGDSPGRAGDR